VVLNKRDLRKLSWGLNSIEVQSALTVGICEVFQCPKHTWILREFDIRLCSGHSSCQSPMRRARLNLLRVRKCENLTPESPSL
jgi:hypothetical protein